MSLDNVGVWNLRVENLDRWYLGHETYMRIINPEENGETEMGPPANVRYCGALQGLQKYLLKTVLTLHSVVCDIANTALFCFRDPIQLSAAFILASKSLVFSSLLIALCSSFLIFG